MLVQDELFSAGERREKKDALTARTECTAVTLCVWKKGEEMFPFVARKERSMAASPSDQKEDKRASETKRPNDQEEEDIVRQQSLGCDGGRKRGLTSISDPSADPLHCPPLIPPHVLLLLLI